MPQSKPVPPPKPQKIDTDAPKEPLARPKSIGPSGDDVPGPKPPPRGPRLPPLITPLRPSRGGGRSSA